MHGPTCIFWADLTPFSPQELVSQILLTCLQPVVILLGVCLYDMVADSRSARWMQLSRCPGARVTIDQFRGLALQTFYY
jgi:hypothetical protein